jgi:hypothetical protein
MSDPQQEQRENVPSQPPRDGGERPRQQQQQQQRQEPSVNPKPPQHPDGPQQKAQ